MELLKINISVYIFLMKKKSFQPHTKNNHGCYLYRKMQVYNLRNTSFKNFE